MCACVYMCMSEQSIFVIMHTRIHTLQLICYCCLAPSTFVVTVANDEKDMALRVETDAARYVHMSN